MPRSAFSAHLASAKSDRWGTPRPLVELICHEFPVAVDLAALQVSKVVPAYFGPDHQVEAFRDALTADWTSVIRAVGGNRFAFGFLNPPFSILDAFMRKVWQERQRGARIVCVLPQKTETVWYHEVAVHADAIRQLRGRLPYVAADKADPDAPDEGAFFPSSVMVFDGLAPMPRTGPHVTWWDTRAPKARTRTAPTPGSFSEDPRMATVAIPAFHEVNV